MAAPPVSLYLHFPWCVRKCPYCDFNSHAVRDGVPEDAYVDALLRDLDWELAQQPCDAPLQSIFMGGGTPSLFSAAAIARVLDGVRARLALAPDAEITLEANPGTADAGHFTGYRQAGVNRLSIGVQSLSDEQLRRLGRIHDAATAHAAYAAARAAGFANVKLDLMYALPRQEVAEAALDLTALCSMQPEHVSWYQLTLEPNTEFHARPPPLPDEDNAWSMHLAGADILPLAGYAQYEVSAWARPGFESRHNLNYWQFGDYLGIGAGAHGKRTASAGPPAIRRRARTRHPKAYLQGAGTAAAIQEEGEVAAADLPFEYAMNALRLNRGFALADFEQRTGLPRSALDAPLAQARARGLLEDDAQAVRPNAFGRSHLNALLRLFLP